MIKLDSIVATYTTQRGQVNAHGHSKNDSSRGIARWGAMPAAILPWRGRIGSHAMRTEVG